MPDITCCTNETCPLRDKCYRAIAEWDYYQSVARFQYQEHESRVMCDWFWDNSEYNKRENAD